MVAVHYNLPSSQHPHFTVNQNQSYFHPTLFPYSWEISPSFHSWANNCKIGVTFATSPANYSWEPESHLHHNTLPSLHNTTRITFNGVPSLLRATSPHSRDSPLQHPLHVEQNPHHSTRTPDQNQQHPFSLLHVHAEQDQKQHSFVTWS